MTDSAVGMRVGEFEIIRELSRDESGIVYEARDAALGRLVTLRLLPAATKQNSLEIDGLISSAHAAAALDHPNIGVIYQVGQTADGTRFIASVHYDGESLTTSLQKAPRSRGSQCHMLS